jgi:hypothetical protein
MDRKFMHAERVYRSSMTIEQLHILSFEVARQVKVENSLDEISLQFIGGTGSTASILGRVLKAGMITPYSVSSAVVRRCLRLSDSEARLFLRIVLLAAVETLESEVRGEQAACAR